MVKADVFLTPAVECKMPRSKRKRDRCWGSGTWELTGASPSKKSSVEDADSEETRSQCRAMNDDTVSDSNVPCSSEQSVFTQGSGTGCRSSGTIFLSTGPDGCNQDEVCEMRGESEALEAETSKKPVEEATEKYCGDSAPGTPKNRPRQLKKVHPGSPVSGVRSLLSTGLLEGLPVTYHFNRCKVGIDGFIKGWGYLCGCSSCNYTKVLSALEFEKHSGGASKNQNDHILLGNGKSLYKVFKELEGFCLRGLQDVIEKVIGCPPNWKCYRAWKETFEIGSHGVQNTYQKIDEKESSQSEIHNEDQIVGRSYPQFPEYTQESPISSDRKSHTQEAPVMIHETPKTSYHGCSRKTGISSLNYVTQESHHNEKRFSGFPGNLQTFPFEDRNIVSHTSKGRRRATKMSRSSDSHCMLEETINPNSSAQACAKKRDSDLHRLIFAESGLPDGAELAYCVRGQKVLKGYKLGSAIVCSCCHKKISPSQFEVHAGWATKRQPYRNIFTSNGVSLHDLSISLSKGQHLTVIRSDDECSICGDGGGLILCAQCPKAFHIVCLGLRHIPDGEWYCTYCKDEPPSGVVFTDAQMAVRVTRIIVPPSLETGCCSICRCSNFSCSDSFNDETVLICDQCEKEYHIGCLRSSGLCDLQVLPKGNWFCCSNCMSINAYLQNIAFIGTNIISEGLINQLKMKLQEKHLMNEPGFEVRCRLLSGKIGSSENKFLLSKAFENFHNGFEPITEQSGHDLIPAMVYGRNMGGHELGGMYCAILTVNSVVVSAAIVRVFGNEAAEIPLVATTQESQGKGYFGCLFSCIEMLLRDLNVETLILPAMENVESMWIHKFGFRKMAEEQFRKIAEVLPIMMFRGTKMLEKPLLTATR